MESVTYLDYADEAVILVALVVIGIPLIYFSSSLLQYFFSRVLRLQAVHVSPRAFVERAIARRLALGSDPNAAVVLDLEDAEHRSFFGYYDQPYFKLSAGVRYLRTNTFLMLYLLVEVSLLAIIGLLGMWLFDINPATIFQNASLVLLLGVLHISDALRGFMAYMWVVWTNKIKLGDEIEIENSRGILVEIGVMRSVVYTVMRNTGFVPTAHTGAAAAPTAGVAGRAFSVFRAPSVVVPAEQRTLAAIAVPGNAHGYQVLPLDQHFSACVNTSALLNAYKKFNFD